MIVKLIKYSVAGVFGLLVVGVLILLAGAQMSLDRDYTHTQAAAALPVFSPVAGDNLVKIAANGMEFRARTAGFNGDADKPVVILLHGFPVTSAMWSELIDPLASSGCAWWRLTSVVTARVHARKRLRHTPPTN